MSRLSRVCREGQPGAKHPPCANCDCACHNLRAPIGEDRRRGFREQVEQAREAARAREAAERQDGAA